MNSLWAANKWHIEQMDIVSAYISGTLGEEIYMKVAERHSSPDIGEIENVEGGLKRVGYRTLD
jgi:hypothetical protein